MKGGKSVPNCVKEEEEELEEGKKDYTPISMLRESVENLLRNQATTTTLQKMLLKRQQRQQKKKSSM